MSWRYLRYGGQLYKGFKINQNGDVKNLKTGYTYNQNYLSSQGKYPSISLAMGKRGDVKVIKIHKALMETFCQDEYEEGKIVHHKNSDKDDYDLDNLEWKTPKDHKIDHVNDGYIEENILRNNRVFGFDDLRYIRECQDLSNRELAEMFNVSKTTISNIKNYKYYNGYW